MTIAQIASHYLKNLPMGRNDSGKACVAVTPNDGADLTNGLCRALWVGTAGDISIDDGHGQTAVVHKNVSGLFPFEVKRVRVTGTTATDIVAWY